MTISDVIKKLQEIKEKEGDVEVYTNGYGWGYGLLEELEVFTIKEKGVVLN